MLQTPMEGPLCIHSGERWGMNHTTYITFNWEYFFIALEIILHFMFVLRTLLTVLGNTRPSSVFRIAPELLGQLQEAEDGS